MNFVQQLEECLRDLAAEARKKHPGVKEASEKAVLKLRTLKQVYVASVRQATNAGGEHPTTTLFQSSDLLHPFLLAANYPNASSKLLEISFRAMRLLMEADAIVPTDGLHMVRVWIIQGQVVVAYYQRLYAKELSTEKTETVPSKAAAPSSSGWFGWGGSSASSSSAPEAATPSKPVKNAVSSSTGQTGQSSQSPKEMEKLALEILCCILQLLELLRNYPTALTTELWTNSVVLGCMWLPSLPTKHTVQQAARSTVSQVLSLLYQTAEYHPKLASQTWEDLLELSVGETSKKGPVLVGAFGQCRSSSTSCLPSPELALDLMTQLWRHKSDEQSDKLMAKTMSVTMGLLQQTKQASVEKTLRIFQWTLVVLLTQGRAYPIECRELFVYLFKPIQLATEACRNQHDFEDGFVYTRDESSSGVTSDSTSTSSDVRRRPTQTLVCFIPTPILWKAGMALEAIYSILEKDPEEFMILIEESSTLANLAETLSDFATIGASCRDHILQLVDFCQSQAEETSEFDPERTTVRKTDPAVFRKVEQIVASGNAPSTFADDSASTGTDRKSSTSTLPPPPLLGEALWIAFKGMLRITDALRELEDSEPFLEDTFAPLVAVMQHYLKRLGGSRELVELTLTGYEHLADTCLPLQGNTLQRKALLTSLCKLSLPSWGKHDSSCQLEDHHVRALLCLLRIVHVHYAYIASGWQTILWTFEELSVLAVASPKLSGYAYQGALAVSAVYSRFAAFSTCLSTESLMQLTEALTEISKSTMENRTIVGDSDTLLPEKAPIEATEKTSLDEPTASISGKIMTMGVRAIYGAGNGEHEIQDVPIAERTKNSFYEDSRQDFSRRITASKSTIRLPTIGRMPFVLTLLADVAMANSFRYKECGESISAQLSRLAASTSSVRAFAMDTLATLLTYHISKEKSFPAPFIGPGRIVFENPKPNQLLAVEATKGDGTENVEAISQSELMVPLCAEIRTTTTAGNAEAALGALNSVLEGAGHHLVGDVWAIIIGAVSSLSGDPSYEIDRSSPEWSKCCLVGFRCLKLIVNDFLDQLPSASDSSMTARTALLDCCSSFGSSRHDVNTSLTAIGLLWTIADQDAGATAIDRALSKLVILSTDGRLEVRNCAVNTLFSCIVGRGGGFSQTQWETCICNTIFGVYETVASKAVSGGSESEKAEHITDVDSSRYKVAHHHSRDSAGKQWATTQVLVLQGLMRVLRNFFPRLLDTTDNPEQGTTNDAPWFQDAWVKIIDFAFDAAQQGEGRDALEIRSVGVEMLTVCCQLSSKAGIHAATTPARVGTNMEVVNGALRSVRESQPSKTGRKDFKRTHSVAVQLSRQSLFLEAFESLESYQEFLENEANSQTTNGVPTSDARIQILQRFTSGLSKVYDCCKDMEFAVDNEKRSLQSLRDDAARDTRRDELDRGTRENDLESRFVMVVGTVLQTAGSDSTSRFLNQAQRASLQLLKTIASDGSSEAFKELVSLARMAFFVRKETETEETESSEFGETVSSPLIGFEAAAVVSEEISKETVSDECRLFVLVRILSFFLLQSEDVGGDAQTGHRRRRYYKRLIPILTEGLRSVTRLESKLAESSDDSNEQLSAALNLAWKDVCGSLSQMLSPVPVGKDLTKMPRVHELIEIVTVILENVPPWFAADLSTILSYGASKAFEVARVHDAFSRANPESELGHKSQRHRVEVLKLFTSCFNGACSLNPDDVSLRSIARQSFSGAVEASASESAVADDVSVETTLILCDTMQENKKMESLAISVFPLLCKLVTCENTKLRDAVSDVFNAVDVAGILETARDRYEDAEKRAKQAEDKVSSLTATVEALEKKNRSLQQEVLAAASSVL